MCIRFYEQLYSIDICNNSELRGAIYKMNIDNENADASQRALFDVSIRANKILCKWSAKK